MEKLLCRGDVWARGSNSGGWNSCETRREKVLVYSPLPSPFPLLAPDFPPRLPRSFLMMSQQKPRGESGGQSVSVQATPIGPSGEIFYFCLFTRRGVCLRLLLCFMYAHRAIFDIRFHNAILRSDPLSFPGIPRLLDMASCSYSLSSV